MLPKGFKYLGWRWSKFDSPSDSGSPVKVKYAGRYDSDGRVVLDEVGVEDIYTYIQSFADDCDINVIMEQFQRSGDYDLINRAKGFYIDASDLPKDWSEIFNLINSSKDSFDKMPPEFKELYGNDFARFAATFDPADFAVDDSLASVPVNVPEVKEGDSDE